MKKKEPARNPAAPIRSLATIEWYAKKCGVSVQAIHGRIKRKKLKAQKMRHEGFRILFIDIEKFPPNGKLRAGRKKLIPLTIKELA